MRPDLIIRAHLFLRGIFVEKDLFNENIGSKFKKIRKWTDVIISTRHSKSMLNKLKKKWNEKHYSIHPYQFCNGS